MYIFRDNGVKAIENLMTKRGRFDYVLLETTGLADPGMDYILTLCVLFLFPIALYNVATIIRFDPFVLVSN